MKSIHTLDAGYARYRLDYNPISGVFVWKNCNPRSNRGNWFIANFLGREAGHEQLPDYYRKINIDGKSWGAHRLAWLIMTGENPDEEIDHIDGNPRNNKWNNLRKVSHSQNSKNLKTPKNNTSGYKGVTWDKDCNRWMAQIICNGKRLKLGLFDDPKIASVAYEKAAEELFGEFKRKVA